MVAFVFGTQAEFKAYCEVQNDQSMVKMRGYYSPKTNRVTMYEDPNQITPQYEPTRTHQFLWSLEKHDSKRTHRPHNSPL